MFLSLVVMWVNRIMSVPAWNTFRISPANVKVFRSFEDINMIESFLDLFGKIDSTSTRMIISMYIHIRIYVHYIYICIILMYSNMAIY